MTWPHIELPVESFSFTMCEYTQIADKRHVWIPCCCWISSTKRKMNDVRREHLRQKVIQVAKHSDGWALNEEKRKSWSATKQSVAQDHYHKIIIYILYIEFIRQSQNQNKNSSDQTHARAIFFFKPTLILLTRWRLDLVTLHVVICYRTTFSDTWTHTIIC